VSRAMCCMLHGVGCGAGALQAKSGCVAWVLETDLHYCFLKATVSATPCASVPVGSPCR